MTIKELYIANENMDMHDICVINCEYDFAERMSIDDILNGCIIYQDEYYTMPEVLKDLKVDRFKCLSHSSSTDEPSKWIVWVV